MGLVTVETLKSLCCDNGWCYGAFWRFDQGNPMLVTMEDFYFKEEMYNILSELLVHAHVVGEGIVGYAAFTGKPQWLFSDTYGRGQRSASFEDLSQDASGIQKLFASGIKTIVVISVDSQGVVQFGSAEKIVETQQFVDQTMTMLRNIENSNDLNSVVVPPTALTSESDDLTEWFNSSGNVNIASVHHTVCNESMEMSHLFMDSSYDMDKLMSTESEVPLSSNPVIQLQHLASVPATPTALDTKITYIDTMSQQNSHSTSTESWPQSEIGAPGWSSAIAKDATSLSWGSILNNCFEHSILASLYNTKGWDSVGRTTEENCGPSMSNRHSTSLIQQTECGNRTVTILNGFWDEFKVDDFTEDLSDTCVDNNVVSCFAPTSERNISGIENIINDKPTQLGITSVPSGRTINFPLDDQLRHKAHRRQSAMHESCFCSGPEIINSENSLFEVLGLKYGCGQATDCWDGVMTGAGDDQGFGDAECISELDVCTILPRKGPLSELLLKDLLDGIRHSKPIPIDGIDAQSSATKRKRAENLLCDRKQGNVATGSWSSGSRSHPAYRLEAANSLLQQEELLSKVQVGSVVDDNYGMNAGYSVAKNLKREEPKQAARKRARPGESTRPRPKDRQQIQDRIKELRGIIPDGSKLSIDQLLDRAAKHMYYLQGVTKLADKLKQIDVPKLIDQENDRLPRDKKADSAGATWALEVGQQSTVFPLIVEDLNTPGMMLIEMLCEDHGLFLEIADTIRGFGLNVLKGVMERREDKILAHFIAEVQKPITRLKLFLDLVNHLKLTTNNATVAKKSTWNSREWWSSSSK